MLEYTPVPDNYKKCTKCGKILPTTREFFYFRGGVVKK